MKRLSVILLSALIAAAPLSAATAQDRGGRGDRGRPEAQRDQQREVRIMSASQAQAIAQSRAPGADFKRSRESGGIYTFTFERDGRVFEVVVDGRQ